jgi:nitrogen fixation/metabolism regulation signal transduction histidine kinase
VSDRARFVAYLTVVHVVLAIVGVYLFRTSPYWLFPLEIGFAASLLTGIRLTRGLFRNFAFARSGLQMLKDRDFMSRFREIGHPDVDALIRLYNGMVDNLREERTRLQEQHHFLTDILQVSPSGIVVLDFDGRIATVNPAAERMLGAGAAALLAKTLDEVDTPLGEALATLAPGAAEVVTLAGARRVRVRRGTFVDRGFPRSFLLVEEMTEELRQVERGAYEKLIRVMAHEVNNSVTASNSLLHSSLTYSGEISDEHRADFVQAIGIVIGRTEQLNQFMQSFARVFRLPPPQKRPERVLSVLEGHVRLLSARPDASAVTWRWDVDDAEVTVPMDRGQMDQAFLNVLQNAVDAAGGCGTVTIRLHARNGSPAVMIDDTGPGITAEALANLFTPFFSTKPHGQGIGLTLVREILTAHGFDYSLERAGDVTRFTIVF